MILPTKPAQYALRALCFITGSGDGAICQVESISKSENIPGPYLAKVLKRLAERKILKSVKGPGGGFVLSKPPAEISLYEVIAVFDDIDEEFKRCAVCWSHCNEKNPCPLHHRFARIKKALFKHLKETNLSVFEESKKIRETIP